MWIAWLTIASEPISLPASAVVMPPTTSADCIPIRLIAFCTAPALRQAAGSLVRSCKRAVRVSAISVLPRQPTKLARRASSGACHSYSPHLTFRGGGQSASSGSRPCRSWNSAASFFRPPAFEQAPVAQVRRAIENGTLSATTQGRTTFVTRTDATRWISRGTPAGDTQKSWISLETAQQRYLFSIRDLKGFMASDALKSKTGAHGAMRGIVYVSKAQCARLREEIGFTEQEAARRAKITVSQFQDALRGADWRGTGAIPLATVQAVIKRLHASPGYSIAEAARAIGKDAAWVEDRIRDGTVRPLRTRHTPGRLYLSEPMIRRLRAAVVAPRAQTVPQVGWLRLGEAAVEAGVTAATIIKWATAGELERTRGPNGWRYAHDAVRTRAQAYWQSSRFHRATPPVWLRSATVT